jgi:hypothetical protein
MWVVVLECKDEVTPDSSAALQGYSASYVFSAAAGVGSAGTRQLADSYEVSLLLKS